jgi:monoamine oxidase
MSRGMALARAQFALHERSAQTGVPVDELAGALAQERARGLTRRELLGRGALLAGAALATRPAALARAASSQPRIAIVGGGLAGLRCAHLLWTGSGVASTVYEGNPSRAGGRCWSLRNYFSNGLLTEHGGQFINSNQHQILNLASSLGLSLEDVNGGDLLTGQEVYYVNGQIYTYADVNADWKSFGYAAFSAANSQASTTSGANKLDAMSVPQWLASTSIGTTSNFGQLMLSNAVTEYGGDPSDQSALNLIYLLANAGKSSIGTIPGDDEKYHIVGGNDQLVSGMIAQLPSGAVQLGYELTALVEQSNGSVALTFNVGGTTKQVVADIVVLALPFTTLRNVALTKAGLSATKVNVIQTFPLGTNAKVHLQLTKKTWPALGYSGATYGPWGQMACGWDDSVPQGANASPALFVAFPGAEMGATGLTGAAHGPAPAADVTWALDQIDYVYPGTTAAYGGLAYEDHWAIDPWTLGAYSYDGIGQATTYGKLAAATDGPYYFAGEHCAVNQQGFLEGAIVTGQNAATAIVSALG